MDIAIMPPINNHAMQQSAGFTLLEILIALFIFSIISIMMAGALHTVINAQSGAEHSAMRIREMQLAFVRMGRDIEQAVNRPIRTANDQESSAFYGTTRGFAFTHGGMSGEGGLHQVLQRAQYIVGKEGLWRMAWDVLDLTSKSPLPSQRKILADVTSARFEYLDDKSVFHKDWPVNGAAAQVLPRAVRITLTIKDWGSIQQTYVIPAESPKSVTRPGAPGEQSKPEAKPDAPPEVKSISPP
jgi:general secretion pathway protein J